jgi:EcsC protein family
MEIVKPESVGSPLTLAELPAEERATLKEAMNRLRGSRGVVVRAADLLASTLGPAAIQGFRHLSIPAALVGKAQALAEAALRRAFDLAVVGVRPGKRPRTRLGDRMGRLAAATSGAIGGFAGLSGFLQDVTLTTLLIMRRIAAIAVEEGEDLSTEEARAACLEVFAFDAGEPASVQGPSAHGDGDAEIR